MTKNRKLELSPRLQLLADWVPSGVRIVDVGTDHAFLPVWLMLNGKVSSAIASDLRPGPLARGACVPDLKESRQQKWMLSLLPVWAAKTLLRFLRLLRGHRMEHIHLSCSQ